jgi:hypothetical protein
MMKPEKGRKRIHSAIYSRWVVSLENDSHRHFAFAVNTASGLALWATTGERPVDVWTAGRERAVDAPSSAYSELEPGHELAEQLEHVQPAPLEKPSELRCLLGLGDSVPTAISSLAGEGADALYEYFPGEQCCSWHVVATLTYAVPRGSN